MNLSCCINEAFQGSDSAQSILATLGGFQTLPVLPQGRDRPPLDRPGLYCNQSWAAAFGPEFALFGTVSRNLALDRISQLLIVSIPVGVLIGRRPSNHMLCYVILHGGMQFATDTRALRINHWRHY